MITDNDQHIGPAEMALLLSADPSEKNIHIYLSDAIILKQFTDNVLSGILVMGLTDNGAEIYNVAIAEEHQGKGFGQQLLRAGIEKCRSLQCRHILIGTGNSSVGQLYLYQKLGFEITGIRHNYFVEHYSTPIIENGIPCKHMIRLRMDL
ncbi:GNAT family N-acetyltransferase [Chitinophaga nivalis]|uniref:GNAT family N-acetyltransferase n=1 Tax=Chitinophaga nivalis TaxID=2991709 RepID=A0ABT3IFG3_9BACT|nr:GNAT family N-acetyltransferase [Chitinophaga nivalis]MCW3467627.1 GNAT family N-acetyltransferase [Chitinophaga nivalis]MCW3482681.1 GNAT family N-acetyltransferase [Chitinophaga nivalis]